MAQGVNTCRGDEMCSHTVTEVIALMMDTCTVGYNLPYFLTKTALSLEYLRVKRDILRQLLSQVTVS